MDENVLAELSDLFKVFGDTTRVKILFALSESPLFVGDIASKVGMSDSAVSHQLSILKLNRLVKASREGRSLRYSLDDAHVSSILNIGLEHLCEKKGIA